MNNKQELDIEQITQWMIEGESYRSIASKLNVPLSTLHKFCSQPVNTPCVRLALDVSAQTYAEKALEVLINAPSTLTEITRAKEIAQYYKWLASKRSPSTFSDKYGIDLNTTKTKTIKVKAPDSENSENQENQ